MSSKLIPELQDQLRVGPLKALAVSLFPSDNRTVSGLGSQLCGVLCALATVTHFSVAGLEWDRGVWNSVVTVEFINGVMTLLAYGVWRWLGHEDDSRKVKISRWISMLLIGVTCLRWMHGWLLMPADVFHVQIVSGLLYLPLLLASATLLELPSAIVIGSILWMGLVPLCFAHTGQAAEAAISDWRIGPSIVAAYIVYASFLRSIKTIIGQHKVLTTEATVDPLTECLNRRGLKKALDGIDPSEVSLLLLDIDHFKSINDTHGHDIGDSVIATVAQLIRNSVRRGDNVCRWGGEEFLVVLHTQLEDQVLKRAESIRQRIEQETWRHLHIDSFKVTISIGLCSKGRGFEEDVAEADRALFVAKEDGRNCVRAIEGT